MPRNPDKIRCTFPGCRSWAMHGRARCRSHLDAALGPRGGGAQPANLNALRHRRDSHPLPRPRLERLLTAVHDRPDDLPYQFGLVVHALQSRTGDPYLTLLALRAVLVQLINCAAAHVLTTELAAALAPLPPDVRSDLCARLAHLTAAQRPEDVLVLLRRGKAQRERVPEPG